MLTFIAICCLLFGWICASCLARERITKFVVGLIGICLSFYLAYLIYEEADLHRRLRSAQWEYDMRLNLDRTDALLDSIRRDEQRLRELCRQYPGLSGC